MHHRRRQCITTSTAAAATIDDAVYVCMCGCMTTLRIRFKERLCCINHVQLYCSFTFCSFNGDTSLVTAQQHLEHSTLPLPLLSHTWRTLVRTIYVCTLALMYNAPLSPNNSIELANNLELIHSHPLHTSVQQSRLIYSINKFSSFFNY